MRFEKYTQIYDGEPIGSTVRPHGNAFELCFDLKPEANKKYRLFTVGQTHRVSEVALSLVSS